MSKQLLFIYENRCKLLLFTEFITTSIIFYTTYSHTFSFNIMKVSITITLLSYSLWVAEQIYCYLSLIVMSLERKNDKRNQKSFQNFGNGSNPHRLKLFWPCLFENLKGLCRKWTPSAIVEIQKQEKKPLQRSRWSISNDLTPNYWSTVTDSKKPLKFLKFSV